MLAFDGAEVTFIDGLVDCATKLYHTSFLFPAGAPAPHAPATVVYVALVSVPATLVQARPEVNDTAPLQTSLAGALTTQILNAPLAVGRAVVEYALT
jgi:hypothetical protein